MTEPIVGLDYHIVVRLSDRTIFGGFGWGNRFQSTSRLLRRAEIRLHPGFAARLHLGSPISDGCASSASNSRGLHAAGVYTPRAAGEFQ